MNKKRPLTQEEKEIARLLKGAVKRSGKSEATIGANIGVSQGQVSHWTGGRLPVPAKRAVALANELGIPDAASISVELRTIQQESSATDADRARAAGAISQARSELEGPEDVWLALMAICDWVRETRPVEAPLLKEGLRNVLAESRADSLPGDSETSLISAMIAALDGSQRSERPSASTERVLRSKRPFRGS